MLNVKESYFPDSLDEALTLLAEKKLSVFAGGTDLIPAIRDGRKTNLSLLKLEPLQDKLSQIRIQDGQLIIGAMATHRKINESILVQRNFPALSNCCRLVGSHQIRNRATIGGNIVNASPAADTVPVLMAADAQVICCSKFGERSIPLQEFASAPGRTQRRSDELLTEIRIPLPEGGWAGEYYKIGLRNALTINVASVALLYHPSVGWRIALGSVAPSVVRAVHVESLFNRSRAATMEDFEKELQLDAHPIDDVRATAEYRRQVLLNVLFEAYGSAGRSVEI